MNTKIAVIGGGSAYMASVFQGIIKASKTFADAEFVLMDIDEEHLQLMYNLGQTMLNIAGCPVRLKMTTDRIQSLDGAEFVLTTFRPGGLEARHLDEVIPPKYGVLGNETIGPGGLFMACRAIPIMLDIARDVEKVAPKAIILNYTNPTNLVTAAITRHTNVRIIGICDQHVGEKYALANLLGISYERLWSNSIGLNHATWITSLRVDGEDVFPKLREFSRDMRGILDDNLRMSLELFNTFNAIPTYYLRYYYFADEMAEAQKKKGKTRAEEIMGELPSIWRSYEDAIKNKLPRPLLQRGGSDHGEFALEVIDALMNNQFKIKNLNLVNQNAIPDFPEESIVEGPAIISKQEIRLISQKPMPTAIAGLLKSISCYEELAIKAAVHGNLGCLLEALIAHPLVRRKQTAKLLMDDMLKSHQSYLPQFFTK